MYGCYYTAGGGKKVKKIVIKKNNLGIFSTE